MAAPDLVNLSAPIDDAKCFALVRRHRWPEGVRCPGCGSAGVPRSCFQADPARVAGPPGCRVRGASNPLWLLLGSGVMAGTG